MKLLLFKNNFLGNELYRNNKLHKRFQDFKKSKEWPELKIVISQL